jgi:TonB-linked SusC/RagA family outer membrane protein
MLCSLTVYAQQGIQLSGKVIDASNKEPLPGVSIRVQGKQTAASTNTEGTFSISAEVGNTLVFTTVGYKQKEYVVRSNEAIQIELELDNQGLDEVVVIGYGTSKKGNLTGSVSSISADQLSERPVARVEQALQGQMAGVTVRNTSGAPGSDITINVRGVASINGVSTPLYVVDGVPIDNLSGVNPADIQSIDVLKDAASAAIYGSRGSNGVVIVTTKRGRIGKPVISINGYSAFSNLERKVDVLSSDQWIQFNKKWLDRQWVNATGLSRDVSQAERIAYAERANNTTYTTRSELGGIRAAYGIYDPYWGTDALEPIDWQDELFHTAPVNDFQINASGATEITNYSISAGMFDQEGIVHGSSFTRYSLRANLETKINERVKIGLSLSPSIGTRKGSNVDGKDNAVARSLSFPGWVLAGSGRMAGADPYKFYDIWGSGANNVSPYVQAVYNDRANQDMRLNSAFNMTVNIIDGLTANGLVGWNYRGNSERTYSPTWIQGSWDTSTPGERSSSRKTTLSSNSLLAQGTMNYNRAFGDHEIEALIGASQERYWDESSTQGQSNFPNDKTWIFDKDRGGSVISNGISAAENAMISFFSRVQYNYKNRYLFSASLRRDGSSKFGPENRWGWFPALSGAWKLNEESFFNEITWLSTAKLRLSWGQAGNDRIGNSQFLSNMAVLNYPFGDSQSLNNGFVIGNISNSMLGWEKSDSYNLGLDIGFLNDRLFLTTDMYYKKTSNLLLRAPVSLTTGFSNMLDNVGNVDNKGIEIAINSANLIGEFKWNTSLNFSVNRNKITSLGSDNSDIRLGQGSTIIQRVGHPINSYYLLDAVGVLREADFDRDGSGNYIAKIPVYSGQRPGDTKYRDASGDGKIDASDYVVAGNYQPDFEYGLTNNFTYKNFDLSILIQGKLGGDLLSIGSRGWNRPTNDVKWLYMEQWLTKAYWSEEEPGDGKVPAFFSAVTSQYDTNWMYDAGYLRVKNITLGYNIPVKTGNVFNSLRIYTSVDNAYMWDNYYPGFSPEAATQDNASADWGAYPQARTFSFGLNATF